MNAHDFVRMSIDDIQKLNSVNYPQFAGVLMHLNKNPQLELNTILSQFPGQSKSEQLFNLLRNVKYIPKCLCGNELRFKTISQGYSIYCSAKCREQDPHIKVKREAACLERFGVKNAGQNSEIKKKIEQTCLDRFGVGSVLASKHVIEKAKSTKKKIQKNITEKTIASNLVKYGFSCTLLDDNVKEKARVTLLERYGVEHNSRIPSVKEAKSQQLFKYRKRSIFEDDVVQAIIDLGYRGEIQRNVRSIINPQEIDIWLPELKLGIECNGCYWHSDPWKPENYHLIKTEAVEDKGGKLIHLYDFEWSNKNEIVMHRLESALGLGKKLFARKCEVKKITSKEMDALVCAYHIQGPAVAKHRYGLYCAGELVAGMSFSKPRFNKAYEAELIRYVSSSNVVGGASKLLSAFVKDQNPNSIITYADRRWSNGNLYKKIGFKLLRKSKPGYWYFKGQEFKHRSNFQKHKLENILEKFDSNLGEVENMYANGWRRIFDSGTRVYELVTR
jgi:hypothetical protein